MMNALDLWLFRLINGLAGHTPILDFFMRALVTDYIGPTMQALGLMGLWFEGAGPPQRRASQRTVFRAIAALFLASGLLVISNLLYFRARPFRYHEVNLLFYYPSDSSFPSNSATVVFTIATVVWLYNRRWGWPMIALASAFGLSRVYCGVHYPGDILAGFVLGGSSAWLLNRYGHLLDRLFDPVIDLARRLYLA